jgi:hypothetical protein
LKGLIRNLEGGGKRKGSGRNYPSIGKCYSLITEMNLARDDAGADTANQQIWTLLHVILNGINTSKARPEPSALTSNERQHPYMIASGISGLPSNCYLATYLDNLVWR